MDRASPAATPSSNATAARVKSRLLAYFTPRANGVSWPCALTPAVTATIATIAEKDDTILTVACSANHYVRRFGARFQDPALRHPTRRRRIRETGGAGIHSCPG